MKHRTPALLGALLWTAAACGSGGENLSPQAQQGRQVWVANCVACHAMNPSMDGALGPAVAGSSLELLEARVLRAEYPPGYTPKRDSKAMVALPHLESDIPALHAFLDEAGH